MLKQETARIMKRANKIHDQLEQYESDSMMRNSCRWFRKEPPLSSSKRKLNHGTMRMRKQDMSFHRTTLNISKKTSKTGLSPETPKRVCRKTSREARQHCPLHRQRTNLSQKKSLQHRRQRQFKPATVATAAHSKQVLRVTHVWQMHWLKWPEHLLKSSAKQDVLIEDFHMEACPTVRKEFQKWVTNLCDELNRRTKCHDRLETEWILKATKIENEREPLKDVCYPFTQSTMDERTTARWERLDRILYQKLLKMKGTPHDAQESMATGDKPGQNGSRKQMCHAADRTRLTMGHGAVLSTRQVHSQI